MIIIIDLYNYTVGSSVLGEYNTYYIFDTKTHTIVDKKKGFEIIQEYQYSHYHKSYANFNYDVEEPRFTGYTIKHLLDEDVKDKYIAIDVVTREVKRNFDAVKVEILYINSDYYLCIGDWLFNLAFFGIGHIKVHNMTTASSLMLEEYPMFFDFEINSFNLKLVSEGLVNMQVDVEKSRELHLRYIKYNNNILKFRLRAIINNKTHFGDILYCGTSYEMQVNLTRGTLVLFDDFRRNPEVHGVYLYDLLKNNIFGG